MRRRPYCVLLLDEIEKAHSDVFNILLQVLDDGRLTDGQGRTVDFTNAIVIMTSNIGSQYVGDLGAFDQEEMRRRVNDALRAHFRPEFLNRVDDVVTFASLTRGQIGEIVEIQLRALRKRLADRHLELELTAAAKDMIADEGYDPIYGARPLKRVLQRRVLDPLASAVLRGDFTGGETVLVDVDGGSLAFRHGRGRAGVAEGLAAGSPAAAGRGGE